MEAHNVSHARTRLQGDVIIYLVLRHAVEHESSYKCRQGTKQQAEEFFQSTLQKNTVGGKLPALFRNQFNKRLGTRSKTPPGERSKKR